MGNSNSNIKALKSGVWYTISNFIVKAAGFLTTPIFTRLLSSSDVGYVSNTLSWVSILAVITTFDLSVSISAARFDYRNQMDNYVGSVVVLSSSITFLFYLIVIVFREFFMYLFSVNFLTLNLMFSYFLVYPALQMFQMKSRVFYKYKISSALAICSVFASTGGSLIMVILCDDKLFGRIVGYFVPHIVLNLIVYIYILYKAGKLSTKYWIYALKISIPLIWHTLSIHILSSSDRVMITRFCGTSDNALYSVAYSCALIVQVLWTSMNSAWAPWAYEMMDNKDYGALKKASRPFILFFGLIVLIFLLISPEVLFLMGGKKYASAISVIPPVMIGYVFQFVFSLYVNIEYYSKKQPFIAMGTTVAAIVNIVLNLLFIPMLGYVAAAYTTLVGYIVLFMMHYMFVKKLKKEWWYDTKFNFIFLVISMCMIPLFSILYTYNIIRYALIIIISFISLTLVFKLRKEIMLTITTKSLLPVTEGLSRILKTDTKKK